MLEQNKFGSASLALAVAVLIALGASSARAADADNGERLARRWCAACHIVALNQQSATTEAPSFSSIARTPGLDAARIALFLLHPHPKMPDMGLTRPEAADLAAYIASLK